MLLMEICLIFIKACTKLRFCAKLSYSVSREGGLVSYNPHRAVRKREKIRETVAGVVMVLPLTLWKLKHESVRHYCYTDFSTHSDES